MISWANSRGRRVRLLLASAAVASALALGGCNTDGIDMAKAMKPLSPQMVSLIESKGMSKETPILVRLFKEESELEIWKQDKDGQFALLKSYPICRWSGELGPKIKEGDRQAPEGFYTITPAQMNPNSQFYLSFNLGYPNAYDRAHGRTGAHLMVHGDCSSRGCYSMTDEQIAEIYALGREAFFGGQKSFQVQAYPFRMTPLNMAKHRNSPHLAFWKMLKEGNDHFEISRAQPKVDVCEKRYVFNATEPAGSSSPLRFQPTERCPAYAVPEEIASELATKTRRDEIAFADFVRRGTPTVPVITGRDGGMHPVFLAKLKAQEGRDEEGNVRFIVADAPAPGTIPAHVNPPKDWEIQVASVGGGSASVGTPANVPLPRAVPGRSSIFTNSTGGGSAAAYADTKGGSMFSGLYSTGKSAASTVAGVFGFGGQEAKPEPKPKAEARKPAAAPRAQPRPTAVADAKPQSQTSEVQKSEPQPTAGTQTAQAAPPARPAAAASLMSGAQPVVSTGGFDSRWPTSAR